MRKHILRIARYSCAYGFPLLLTNSWLTVEKVNRTGASANTKTKKLKSDTAGCALHAVAGEALRSAREAD